jgi:hypothetical protein
MLVVIAGLLVQDVKELIAFCKGKPNQLNTPGSETAASRICVADARTITQMLHQRTAA